MLEDQRVKSPQMQSPTPGNLNMKRCRLIFSAKHKCQCEGRWRGAAEGEENLKGLGSGGPSRQPPATPARTTSLPDKLGKAGQEATPTLARLNTVLKTTERPQHGDSGNTPSADRS
jgi:hypothetical protein